MPLLGFILMSCEMGLFIKKNLLVLIKKYKQGKFGTPF